MHTHATVRVGPTRASGHTPEIRSDLHTAPSALHTTPCHQGRHAKHDALVHTGRNEAVGREPNQFGRVHCPVSGDVVSARQQLGPHEPWCAPRAACCNPLRPAQASRHALQVQRDIAGDAGRARAARSGVQGHRAPARLARTQIRAAGKARRARDAAKHGEDTGQTHTREDRPMRGGGGRGGASRRVPAREGVVTSPRSAAETSDSASGAGRAYRFDD